VVLHREIGGLKLLVVRHGRTWILKILVICHSRTGSKTLSRNLHCQIIHKTQQLPPMGFQR
jgi:hypothetical protein